jgi:hypothetical protein
LKNVRGDGATIRWPKHPLVGDNSIADKLAVNRIKAMRRSK